MSDLKRTEEDDLIKQCADAGTFYIDKKMQGAPTDERIKILNYISHGFYMGWRKKEESLGITKPTATPDGR